MQGISLQQDMRLQQKLSPAQIQVIRMLEVPGCELNQRINEELQENPALEELDHKTDTAEDNYSETDWSEDTSREDEYDNPLQNEEFDYNDYVQDDETPDYRTRTNNYSADDDNREIPLSEGTSFGEYLKSQVYLTDMDKPDRHIAKFVVGNIDEDGYLRRSAIDLIDDLAFREGLEVSEEKMNNIILQIQDFDPLGVGARDLSECLLIQLRHQPLSPSVEIAQKIVLSHFDDFIKRRSEKICQKLGIDESAYKAACQEITRLNPKPGSAWAGTIYERHQISVIPDFIVEAHDGEISVQLHQDDIPELHISRDYQEMLETYSQSTGKQSTKQKEAVSFIRQKIDSAKWFIDALKQRNETLLKTMQAIVSRQRDFFLDGEDASLHPLVLQDIANITGYDTSTISRVTSSKYVQTNFGIYPLRYFFSEGMITTSGEEVSTREIKQVLLELIKTEDKQNIVIENDTMTVDSVMVENDKLSIEGTYDSADEALILTI